MLVQPIEIVKVGSQLSDTDIEKISRNVAAKLMGENSKEE